MNMRGPQCNVEMSWWYEQSDVSTYRNQHKTEQYSNDNALFIICFINFFYVIQGIIILKLRGFSPRANHTDRAAAAGRRS